MVFNHIQIEHLKKMCGTKMTPANKLEPHIEKVTYKHKKPELPKEFDARTHWSKCSTIGDILGALRIWSSLGIVHLLNAIYPLIKFLNIASC